MMPVTSILPRAEKVEQVFLESSEDSFLSDQRCIHCPLESTWRQKWHIFFKWFFFFFDADHFLKVLIEFVIILLLLFMFWILGHKGIWDLSPLTRDWTHTLALKGSTSGPQRSPSCGSSPGDSVLPLRDTWLCLETQLYRFRCRYCWQAEGGGQGCWKISYNAQDRPIKKNHQAPKIKVLLLRIPAAEDKD